MTEIDHGIVHFDIRQSVRGRNIARLIIAPSLSIGLILFGLWLIPETAVLELAVDAIETWSISAAFGFISISAGIYGLLKECVFALRALSTTGEWHFRLTDQSLLWQVPRHAHGREEGFEALLSEVTQIEFRTLQKYDEMDERAYWIHFRSRAPIQLMPYSGIGLSWLAGKISDAGVPYKETIEQA